MDGNKFSVAISVYKNDSADFFDEAMLSIINQTVPPNEIVLVIDGPVSNDIKKVITHYKAELDKEKKISLIVLPLKENVGLGKALNIAIKNCTYDLIARMDSDDICVQNRFELQLEKINANPQIDILGGNIIEFIDNTNNCVGRRVVPCDHEKIIEFARKRCPFNHMTVMFKKNSVLKAGNYLDWHYNEDYFLWIRMIQKHMTLCNLTDNLVFVRVGNEMYQRRGGKKYFFSELKIQLYMLKEHFISPIRFLQNILIRIVVELILPNNCRSFVFQHFIRRENHDT